MSEDIQTKKLLNREILTIKLIIDYDDSAAGEFDDSADLILRKELSEYQGVFGVSVNIVDRKVIDFRSLPQSFPVIDITAPDYFEDDQPCGYCHREIGAQHENWCRQ